LGDLIVKIGIMLRHYEHPKGGVRNYTRNLLDCLLPLDNDHEFVLLYQEPGLVGEYRQYARVQEVCISCPTKLAWDQFAVPLIEHRTRLDLIFNPKYSLPLGARCRTVFVCHGLDWYVMPWGSKWIDRISHRYLVPRYAEKADGIIAVSHATAADCGRFLGVPDSKLGVIYHGIGESFLAGMPDQAAGQIVKNYSLPETFLLYVGGIYPAKNFGRLIRAYAKVGPELGIHLVVAGEHMYMSEDEIRLVQELGLSEWVRFTGWIDHDELPALYQRARALLLPSLYEACPSPILEAMTVGCPVLTGEGSGMSEMAGGAALLVDSGNVESIASGIQRIATDAELRSTLREAGKSRVRGFSWERCAEETLDFLEGVAAS
jgi:glycosyltransferase involved in cell wall biosynthesis